jgi:TaqI-like C-terminal specificity domain
MKKTTSSKSQPTKALLEKLNSRGVPFDSLCDFSAGIQAYEDESAQAQRVYHAESQKDSTYKKELNSNDVRRYFHEWEPGHWVSYGDWLAYSREPQFFKGPRLLVREIVGGNYGIGAAIMIGYDTHKIRAAYVEDEYINDKRILNIIEKEETKELGYDVRYFLALLNSSLMSWTFSNSLERAMPKRNPRISILNLKELPIRTLNFKQKAGIARHDALVGLVHNMEEHAARLRVVTHWIGASVYSRQMGEIDREIDKLVYQLYGLTDAEIKIVEREAK